MNCTEEGRIGCTMFRIPAIRIRKKTKLRTESFSGQIFNGQTMVFMCFRIYIFPLYKPNTFWKQLSFILVLCSPASDFVKKYIYIPLVSHNYPVRQVLMFISFLYWTSLRLNEWQNQETKQEHLIVQFTLFLLNHAVSLISKKCSSHLPSYFLQLPEFRAILNDNSSL